MVQFIEKDDKDYYYVFKRRKDGSAGKLLGKVSKAEDSFDLIMFQLEKIKEEEQKKLDRVAANNRRRRENFTPEQIKKERKNSKEYYHANKDYLNRKRVEDQKIQRAIKRDEKEQAKYIKWREEYQNLKNESEGFVFPPTEEELLETEEKIKELLKENRLLLKNIRDKKRYHKNKQNTKNKTIENINEDTEDFYRYF